MRLASRVPGRGPQSPPLAPHTRDASRSLPPTPTPLVFKASENTMTRPPENRRHRSRPRTRTPSRAATAKQHPERKASRGPSHRRALSGERDRENRHARDRQCQGLNYSRGPRQRRVSRPTSTGPPLSSSPTHRTHHTRTHTLSISPPYRRSPLDDDPDRNTPFVRHPESFVQKYTDPQSDVARAARLGRHLRSRYRCSMCSAVRMDSRTLLRSSSIHEPSDPPSKVII